MDFSDAEKNISKHPFASPDKIKVMRSEKQKVEML